MRDYRRPARIATIGRFPALSRDLSGNSGTPFLSSRSPNWATGSGLRPARW